VEWLNPAAVQAAQLMVRAGDPFRMVRPEGVDQAVVTTPTGEKVELPLEPNAKEIVFGRTGHQGVYRLTAGTNDVTFCVNLLDSAEGNLMPRDELPFGRYAKVEATTLRQANMELWRWIAAAGLLVLLFEWWYYHRRTA